MWLSKGTEPMPAKARRRQATVVIRQAPNEMHDCEARLRRDPGDKDALFTKATFLTKIGKYGDALVCLEHLAEVDQYYPGLWPLKAVVHEKMGDKRMAGICTAIADAALKAEVEGQQPS